MKSSIVEIAYMIMNLINIILRLTILHIYDKLYNHENFKVKKYFIIKFFKEYIYHINNTQDMKIRYKLSNVITILIITRSFRILNVG